MSETPGGSQSGFFSALFDVSFEQFVTRRVISVLYVLAMVAAALWGLMFLGGTITSGEPGLVLVGLIAAPLGFFLAVIYVRVLLEVVVVLFRVGEHTDYIARTLAGQGPPGGGGPPPSGPPPSGPPPSGPPPPGPDPGSPPGPASAPEKPRPPGGSQPPPSVPPPPTG